MPFKKTLTPLAIFKQRSQGKRVLILYPRAKSRNLFLTSLLQQPDLTVIYHRVPQEFASVTAWFGHLLDDLVEHFPHTGTRTRQAIQSGEPMREQIAAFIEDLSDVKSNRV